MDIWPFFIIIFIIIFVIYQCLQSRKNEIFNQATALVQQKKLTEAMELYLQYDKKKAVELTIEAPNGQRAILFRMLALELNQRDLLQLIKKASETYRLNRRFNLAAKSQILIHNYVEAAKLYIYGGEKFVDSAISIIEGNPHLFPNQTLALRKLANFAYQKGFYKSSADIFIYAGLYDDASNSLVRGAEVLRNEGRLKEAEKLLDSIKRPGSPLENYAQMTNNAFFRGDFDEAEKYLLITKKMLQSNYEEKIDRQLKAIDVAIRRINDARDLLRQHSISHAQILYSEIIEMGELEKITIPPIVYAEAGLTYEREDPKLAREYYISAATRSKNVELQKQFFKRSRELARVINTPTMSIDSLSEPPVQLQHFNESCQICKQPIKINQRFMACPHCRTMYHYRHLAEWLKMKGTCPHCKERIVLEPIKEIDF